MPSNQTQGIGHQKYPTYVHSSTQSPNFLPVWVYDLPFSRYSTFYDFPIDSHVKISKCHKIFKFWQIANIYHNFCSLMTPLFIIKFGSDWIKTGGGVGFSNFCLSIHEFWGENLMFFFSEMSFEILHPCGPLLTKTKKVLNLNF